MYQEKNGEPSSQTKEIILTVEVLNGQDEAGVHDFINIVKRTKLKCSQLNLLFDLISTEEIIEC